MTEIELLEKIVTNTSSNKNLWVAGIAALAVVFGAVVTGFLQYLGDMGSQETWGQDMGSGLTFYIQPERCGQALHFTSGLIQY